MNDPLPSVSTGDIRAALRKKYAPPARTGAPDWVLIEEARSGAGHDGNAGQCDMLAVNLYQSRGMHLVGYEIKVSVGDMRREIEHPEKAERFARFCRTWWVVTTPKVWDTVGHEIPPNWGVMTLASVGGRLVVKQKPTRRNPVEVPAWWWVGWLGQVYRDAHREMTRDINAKVQEAVAKERERPSIHRERLQYVSGENARLQGLLAAAGIPTFYDEAAVERHCQLSEAVRGVNVNQLRRTAEALAELAESLGSSSLRRTPTMTTLTCAADAEVINAQRIVDESGIMPHVDDDHAEYGSSLPALWWITEAGDLTDDQTDGVIELAGWITYTGPDEYELTVEEVRRV